MAVVVPPQPETVSVVLTEAELAATDDAAHLAYNSATEAARERGLRLTSSGGMTCQDGVWYVDGKWRSLWQHSETLVTYPAERVT